MKFVSCDPGSRNWSSYLHCLTYFGISVIPLPLSVNILRISLSLRFVIGKTFTSCGSCTQIGEPGKMRWLHLRQSWGLQTTLHLSWSHQRATQMQWKLDMSWCGRGWKTNLGVFYGWIRQCLGQSERWHCLMFRIPTCDGRLWLNCNYIIVLSHQSR